MLPDLTLFALAVPAVILTGLAKGGFAGVGIMAVPLLSLYISPVQAAALMLPIMCVQDGLGVIAYRRAVHWGVIALMLPASFIGLFLAYLLAAKVPVSYVELAVGVVSVWGALQRVLKLWLGVSDKKPSKLFGFIAGIGSGFTSMVSHAGSPPFQLYVLPLRLPNEVLAGTTTVFFAIINAVKLVPYAMLGQFHSENLLLSGMLLPVAIAATYAGIWLVRRIDNAKFYKIIDATLFLVGMKLIVDGLRPLF